VRNFVDEKITEPAAMYALGCLSQSEARAFERRLAEGWDGYAEESAVFDAVVTSLALSAPEQTPSADVRERLLARAAGEASQKGRYEVEKQPASLPPQLRCVRLAEGKWDQAAEGVFVKTLFVDQNRGTVTSLVRLEPGARLPRHRHLGIEESVVIEGDCRVNGEVLMPGDYRCAMAGTTDGETTTKHGTTFLMIAPREVENLEA
jgi:anti-sigma factor ChrR (cupin superfamily)